MAQKTTPEEYIATYKDLAITEMQRSGIPASITLAQGILESASGNSRLALEAKNHFGIKCHAWTGNTILHDDDHKDECFRHYNDAKESFVDHTDFLMSRSRYNFLFDYDPTDYKKWAYGLRKAGYATDPRYPERLISLIDRYKLHQYDYAEDKRAKNGKVANNEPVEHFIPRKTASIDNFVIDVERYPIQENNRREYIVAKDGDTYASLSKMLDMPEWELRRYNDAAGDRPLRKGDMVYTETKRRRAARGNDIYRIREGETMHDVAQRFGIRLKRLYSMNKIPENSEPSTGTLLNLRKTKR